MCNQKLSFIHTQEKKTCEFKMNRGRDEMGFFFVFCFLRAFSFILIIFLVHTKTEFLSISCHVMLNELFSIYFFIFTFFSYTTHSLC